MRVCEAPTKIIGIQVGEASLNFIRMGEPTLKVRFALIADGPVGFVDVSDLSTWSPKTLEAMRAFTEALEEDALGLIFKLPTQTAETPQAEGTSEPPQF